MSERTGLEEIRWRDRDAAAHEWPRNDNGCECNSCCAFRDRRWLLERLDELEKAAQDLKDDLLLRGQRDSDGIIVVNVSQRIWSNFNDALTALHAKETPRG